VNPIGVCGTTPRTPPGPIDERDFYPRVGYMWWQTQILDPPPALHQATSSQIHSRNRLRCCRRALLSLAEDGAADRGVARLFDALAVKNGDHYFSSDPGDH